MPTPALESSSQTRLVERLTNPRVFGASCSEVRVVETHISYVLLTGPYAFKIKKAVSLGFLDFTTLDARRFYCERELALNSRFARDIYLDVVRITGTPDDPHINGTGRVIEYAVKMREFPQEAVLTHVLGVGALSAAHIDRLAAEVASFHLAAATVPDGSRFGSADEVLALAIENFTEIDPLVKSRRDRRALATVRAWTECEHGTHRATLAARRAHGFVRACHGDLHLGNIALIDDRPTLFDCIEFNETMRWTDVMADVGFLVMDLIDRGHPDYAARFLNGYLESTGDYDGLRVLRFYTVYRAMVRAKVAGMRAAQAGDAQLREASAQQCGEYLHLARRIARSVDHGLIMTHGPAGSGKTTATQTLLECLNAVRTRTDVERKRLHQLPASARTGSMLSAGLYAPAETDRTYAALATIVRTVLEAGYVAIADGTFLRRRYRDQLAAIARDLRVPFVILDFVADEVTLAARVLGRQRQGGDASEADLTVLQRQLETADPIGPDEVAATLRVAADRAPSPGKSPS